MMKKEENDREWETFSYNVTFLREQNGLTKKEMAGIMGVSVGTLNKIERGVLPPRLSVEVLFHVWDRFGAHPADLLSKRLD